MLREWFEYLTTPCPTHLRRLGYLRQMIGLRARHRRCRDAWEQHLDRTRRMISEAAAATPAKNRVLVLGSGLLLDVPLERLAADFSEVVLVDLLHMPVVRRRVREHPGVSLIECDVTGLAAALADLAGNAPPGRLPRRRPDALAGHSADLVVSCNILSQLPLVPRDFLEEKLGFGDGAELDAFCHDMLRDHLAWLAGFDCRICLVCDRARQVLRDGDVVDEEDALFGLQLPAPDAEWTWDIAPAPEIDSDFSLRHRVIAYRDFNQTATG